ncbi:hypothetical protein NC652_022740 [Populus alba x Populus x berolinensis]|uniref:Uncharacterized protein n=1 Tax=Populus alba x Populus x berolinensis TaxID=444605 RepID=A0AAD6MEZ7_9ROSI|nr:hypothetical protein NC652_022740 [Populus alba x Populus x berolinensis]KAJ6984298.1 hypothetical protein NC653_022536 [Populus alba x Populus x berolinensis]
MQEDRYQLPWEALIFNSRKKLPPHSNSEDGNRIMQRNGTLDSDCYGFVMHRFWREEQNNSN